MSYFENTGRNFGRGARESVFVMRLLKSFLALSTLALTLLAAEPARKPVLLELFTSEGCSSCPPADRLLEQLDRAQPVAGAELIVLSEHVDYWDGSWVDPFSQKKFTLRQQSYVEQFRLGSGYTPQLVVDGHSEMVGGNATQARAAIERVLKDQKLPIALTNLARNGKKLTFHVEFEAGTNGVTLMAALANDEMTSQVARGEIAGRTLKHVAVVRNLRSLGNLAPGAEFKKDLDFAVEGEGAWRVVVFAQDRATGRIVGVAQRRL